MRKKYAGVISALFVLGLILSLFASCSLPLKISDEEALAVLTDLVPKSYDINVIFFGGGLPAVEEAYEEEHTSTAYFKVREDCGYSSVDEIKTAAGKVYSSRYLDGVYVAAFQGVASESADGMVDMSLSARYKEIGGALMVNVAADARNIRGKLTVVSAEVTKKTSKYVIVSTTVTEDGKESVMNIYLTVENGVWLLDSPTY